MRVNYARLDYYSRQWWPRWQRYVQSQEPRLTCQDCGGAGGEIDPVMDDGSGPWMECGWCAGTGLVDGRRRALWLRYKKELANGRH